LKKVSHINPQAIQNKFSKNFKIVELNFFGMVIEVINWKKKHEQDPPIILTIKSIIDKSFMKFTCSEMVDINFLMKLLNSGKTEQLFNLIENNMEEMKAFYKLEDPYRHLGMTGVHSVTCKSYFLFHQISNISWNIQMIPFSEFLQQCEVFEDIFDSVRIRLNTKNGGFFIFQEIKVDELILDFYTMYKTHFPNNLDYHNSVLHIKNLREEEVIELIRLFISFWMTRINLKLCKYYVNSHFPHP
jgi:hypothetical protein